MAPFTFSIFLLACPADDAEIPLDSGDSSADEGVYELPSIASCTYDLAMDEDADGTIDVTIQYELDADENPLFFESDAADGSATTTANYQYDEAGCITHYQSQTEGTDGNSEEVIDCVCDTLGYATDCTYSYSDDDVSYELVYEYVNEYEGDDNLLVHRVLTTYREDEALSVRDYVYEYDALGLQTLDERMIDGALSKRTVSVWLVEDRLQSEDYESFDDEDAYTTHRESTFDEHDRYATTTYTNSSDSTINRIATYTWFDNVYETSLASFDYEMDGTEDLVQVATCTEVWPWSCDITVDGRIDTDDEDDVDDLRPVDGVIDDQYGYAWTCP